MIQLKHLALLVIFLGAVVDQLSAQFEGATIDDRQRAYIEDDGRYWLQKYGSEKGCWRQCIFAWLENNNHQNDDKIIEEINLLLSNGDPDDNWQNGWLTQSRPAQVTLLRILLGYSHVLKEIGPDLIDKIKSLYHTSVAKGDLLHANPNGKARGHVAMYLYAEHFEPDIEVTYPDNWDENDIFPQFSYEGRTYINGQKYRALELSRDWIQATYDFWVSEQAKNQEFASVNYTKVFIDAFALLYDFSQDQTIKRKAKMMLDFLLLEAVINYSANHWGGPHKRMYLGTYWHGYDAFYWQFFWGLLRPTNDNLPIADVYVTSYRPSPVIEDIGILSDESDSYFHINRFSNLAFNTEDHGSYCFVTRNYNLGTGFNWQLNIYSEDGAGANKGKPFMLWINGRPYSDPDNPFSPPPEAIDYYDGGDGGYQYRNAMLIVPTGKPYLHISVGDNRLDEMSNEDEWQFYREGKVAIAIKILSSCAALEVATIGVDYATYQDFKANIKNNAKLEDNRFTTSKGMVITPHFVDGQYPFKRLESEDDRGNKIVAWKNRVMTVRKHGKTAVYDFNNWKYYENPASWDLNPPSPPQGVNVSN